MSGKRLAFVTDKEFRSALLEAEVYNTKYKKYILKTLESSQSKEKVNFDNLTVDHIIPQTLDAYWTLKVSYDPISRNEYSRILHTLGNLTLTGYNSEKGNTDRDVYSNSNLALNREINLKSFNLESVKIRTENLTELGSKYLVLP
ncbi:HNH endonuclease family protein [Erysipelothrix sp. Poltava]|nr:HNH endonuclease family protein [Erysipelothrix sp. Poltava]